MTWHDPDLARRHATLTTDYEALRSTGRVSDDDRCCAISAAMDAMEAADEALGAVLELECVA
jgi:hypothetical protein